MSLPAAIIPKRKGLGGRSDEVHAAIYVAYVVEDVSAEDTAARVNAAHGTVESRNSIVSYANRQGWLKGTGSGPKPHVKAARPQSQRVLPRRPVAHRPQPAPRDEGPDLSPTNALGPDTGPPAAPGNYRMRVHPPNELSRVLADLPAGACHFPVGPDRPGEMDRHLFCGCPSMTDRNYCRAHNRLSHNSAPPQKIRLPR